MNKFLYALLQELKFKCNDCLKTMALKKLKVHKQKGECHRGASNGDDEAEDQVMAEYQPNA